MGTFEFLHRHSRADFLKIVLLAWWINSFVFVGGHMVGNNPYHRRLVLDPNYDIEWETNHQEGRIIINVTANTGGWVGFGIARTEKMGGADLVIGGVDDKGQAYFKDYYAIANQKPIEDPSQDWQLLSAQQEGNQTRLSITRLLDTCDADHDLPITEDLLKVLWSYSEVDNIDQYHFQNRGAQDVYLSDPDLTPPNTASVPEDHDNPNSNLSVIRLTRTERLPPQDTFYSCTFHRLPTTTKKHIIGFNTVFPTEEDRRHVHHIILHRCKPPPGRGNVEFFDGPSISGGSECYILDYPNRHPVPYCREVLHVWGVGGRSIFLPDHAGIPISTEPDEYVMYQVHFDNPQELSNLSITVTLEAFYTNDLREYEVGVLQAGDMQPGPTTILIPPMSTNHVVMGHCAAGCTERFFPNGGGYMFAAFLHTHQTGVGVRFMHMRGDQELPWALHDDNYNFNFQQFRLFKQERYVQAGDTLIHRCTYDNTDRNGTATHGGFSTREEMCTAFIYYYSRNPGFALCRGEITNQDYNYGLLGIGNFTWNQSIRQMVIQEPPEHRGKTIREYINTEIDWTLDFRRQLQMEQIYQPQTSQCPRFFYEDPQEQIRRQLESGILERTGRLPGSDGRGYTSVDEDFMHQSQLSRNARRWNEPPSCSGQNQGAGGRGRTGGQRDQSHNQQRLEELNQGNQGPSGQSQQRSNQSGQRQNQVGRSGQRQNQQQSQTQRQSQQQRQQAQGNQRQNQQRLGNQAQIDLIQSPIPRGSSSASGPGGRFPGSRIGSGSRFGNPGSRWGGVGVPDVGLASKNLE